MPSVVLFSIRTHYMSDLYLIRALGKKGYTVDVFFFGHEGSRQMVNAVKSSRYVHKVHSADGTIKDIFKTLIGLYRNNVEKPILLAAGDVEVGLVDERRSLVLRYFKVPGIIDGADGKLLEMMDKSFQAKRAAAYGMKVPYYVELNLSNSNDMMIDGIKFPCFLKPSKSLQGSKTEMQKCENKDELKNAIDAYRRKNSERSVIAQEFLNISREYAVTGACLDQTVYFAGICKKVEAATYTRGVTVLGEIEDAVDYKEILDKIEEFLKSLHYVGQFDIDLIQSGEILYFNEVNLRVSGIDFAFTRAGANSPAVLVGYLIDRTIPEEYLQIAKPGLKFFNTRCAFEDVNRGYISKAQFNEMKKQADYTLMDLADDPMPSIIIERYFFFRKIKAKIHNVFGY